MSGSIHQTAEAAPALEPELGSSRTRSGLEGLPYDEQLESIGPAAAQAQAQELRPPLDVPRVAFRGFEASDACAAAAVQRSEEDEEALTTDKAPAPGVDIEDALSLVSGRLAGEGGLFTRRVMALGNLEEDLGTPDEPSVEDRLLQAAVDAALGVVTLGLGRLIRTGVSALLPRVFSETLENTGTMIDLYPGTRVDRSPAARAVITAVVDQLTQRSLKLLEREGARVVTHQRRVSTPTREAFFVAQQTALANCAQEIGVTAWTEHRGVLRRDPNGAMLAGALAEAIEAQFATAASLQYAESLAAWLRLQQPHGTAALPGSADGLPGVLTIRARFDDPMSPLVIEEASLEGATDAVFRRLAAYETLTVRDLDVPIRIIGEFGYFQGREADRRSGRITSYPCEITFPARAENANAIVRGEECMAQRWRMLYASEAGEAIDFDSQTANHALFAANMLMVEEIAPRLLTEIGILEGT